MANGLQISEGLGPKKAASDEVGTDYHFQVVKLDFGVPGQTHPASTGVDALPVNSNIRSASSVGNVNVLSASVVTVRAAFASRTKLFLQNNSSVNIYVGNLNTVTTVTGWKLLPGAQLDLSGYTGDVFALAESGTTNDLRYWEIR